LKKLLLCIFLLPACVSTRQRIAHYNAMNDIEHNLMNADIKCNRYEMAIIKEKIKRLENNRFEGIAKETSKKIDDELINDIVDLLKIDIRKILRPYFDLNKEKRK